MAHSKYTTCYLYICYIFWKNGPLALKFLNDHSGTPKRLSSNLAFKWSPFGCTDIYLVFPVSEEFVSQVGLWLSLSSLVCYEIHPLNRRNDQILYFIFGNQQEQIHETTNPQTKVFPVVLGLPLVKFTNCWHIFNSINFLQLPLHIPPRIGA